MTSIRSTKSRELVVGQRGEVLLDPLSHGGDVCVIKASYEVLSVSDTTVEMADVEIELTVASVRYLLFEDLDAGYQVVNQDRKQAVEVLLRYDGVWHTSAWSQPIEFVEWDEIHEIHNQIQLTS